MSEGWVDCPTLGPGWKRREAYRRSGATCGRTDTYYQGPNGEKFRSKIELTRFLGPSQDLTNFDFKNGVLRDPPPKTRFPSCRWPGFVTSHPGRACRGAAGSTASPGGSAPAAKTPSRAAPAPGPVALGRSARLSQAADCASDRPWASRSRGQPAGGHAAQPAGSGPWLRRLKTLPLLQRVGCGACQACQIPEDCGICTVCAARAKDPELRTGRKCLLRRCLKIVKKGFGCGACQGCRAAEDCGSCYICLRRLKPGLKRQWKCLKRRCL
uniref:Methyl-CpG-binding domain protein 1 n=1 Tax=Chelydra serpentina TaxID=8475 RepID=A0A8C3SPH3_CHESE